MWCFRRPIGKLTGELFFHFDKFLEPVTMAAVLSACQNRKSRSQESLKYAEEAVSTATKDDNYVLDLLAQLPPSRELLKHYQVLC